jgi:hypothetical protein
MKTLKSEKGKLYKLQSFETEKKMRFSLMFIYGLTLFSGTKQELLQKDEEWCKEIVKGEEFFKNYNGEGWFRTAKESLLSALDDNDFVIIYSEDI